MTKNFKISDRLKSFKYAFNGILIMIRSQHNAWIHVVATAIVISFGLYLGFTKSEWCWIVLAMISVWTAEAFNTALEFIADTITPDYHPLIGKAKDVAAGAVLITAIGAVVIALLVIGPYLLF